ncbi:MAG: hypothetical protein QXJ65_03215 [Acidilobaceae archaeon]
MTTRAAVGTGIAGLSTGVVIGVVCVGDGDCGVVVGIGVGVV